jgi:phosphohistidine phosphatase
MKTPFLVRHEESSRDDMALGDKDRPLDDRGNRDAPEMGGAIGEASITARFDSIEPSA